MSDPLSDLLAFKGALVGIWLAGLFLAERFWPAAPLPGAVARAPLARLARNLGLAAINFLLSPFVILPLTALAAGHALVWRPVWWQGWPGFGLDLLHYDSCWYNGPCSANYIHIPVVMQWNFFVASHWSVFGEPGLVIFHGFFDDCPNDPQFRCPGRPRVTSLEPALYLGGRYHFNDSMSLTMRIGFPSISIGLSFFP